MPFCGFKIVCDGQDPARWLQCPELRFGVEVEEATGELLRTARRAEWRGLTFTVTPSVTGYVCAVAGSFHKYRNEGLHNADAFGYGDFLGVVADLCQRFGIDPATARLLSLETGVNLALAYSPARVLAAAVSLGKNPFQSLNPARPRLGVYVPREDYSVKIYDKGLQAGKGGANLLRVEVRTYRARTLHGSGLATLADLTRAANVAPLVSLLLDVLDEVIFIDPKADVAALTPAQRLSLETYRHPRTWQEMTRTQRQGQRRRLGRILEKCKHFDYRQDLQNGLKATWKSLFFGSGEAEKMATFSTGSRGSEAVENSYVFQAWMTAANVAIGPLENVPGKQSLSPDQTGGEVLGEVEGMNGNGERTQTPEMCKHSAEGRSPDAGKEVNPSINIFWSKNSQKRTCQTCGAGIDHQRPQSRFCSEKFTGNRGKQCRNKASNHRRTLKNQVMRAKDRNHFLRVTYHGPDGSEYAETLHASEIGVSPAWLDSVRRVEVVPGPDARPVLVEEAAGGAARTWLTDLTNQNGSSTQSFNHPLNPL